MQGGGWDVVSASGDATLRLIYGDTVQPINTDLVPNYTDVFEDLKLQSFNSVAGVPYAFPTVAVRTCSCGTPMRSRSPSTRGR